MSAVYEIGLRRVGLLHDTGMLWIGFVRRPMWLPVKFISTTSEIEIGGRGDQRPAHTHTQKWWAHLKNPLPSTLSFDLPAKNCWWHFIAERCSKNSNSQSEKVVIKRKHRANYESANYNNCIRGCVFFLPSMQQCNGKFVGILMTCFCLGFGRSVRARISTA